MLKRLLLLEPLVLGVAGLMWFQPDGGKIFALVMFKANLCLLTTMLLSNTTPFTELLRVLQRLRMPWMFRHHADADAPVFVRAARRGGADAPRPREPDVHARTTVSMAGAVIGAGAIIRAGIGTRGANLQRHVCARLEMK